MKIKISVVLIFVIFMSCKALLCQDNKYTATILQDFFKDSSRYNCYKPRVSKDYLNDSLRLSSAIDYINSNYNANSYFMMLHIKEYHYVIYESISDSLKIIQYYYHLKECHCADDWSLLTLHSQVDYNVGKLILHSGKKSLPVLKLLLYDTDGIIMCRGTEGNTLTYGYHLRIKDFAYRYAAIILGENPFFLRTREERDGLIDALIKKYPEYLRLD